MPSIIRTIYRDTSGAVLAEFAFVSLMLIVFTFGVVDVGLLLWTDITLNRATHAAARCRAVDSADSNSTCPTNSSAQDYAFTQSWGASLLEKGKGATYDVSSCTSGASGLILPGAQVVGSYTYHFITPLVQSTVALSHTACYPMQH